MFFVILKNITHIHVHGPVPLQATQKAHVIAMGKTQKRAREVEEVSPDSLVDTVLKADDTEPAEKLIHISQLWDGESQLPDYFVRTKSFIDSLQGVAADAELVELYQEYALKTDAALLDEIKQLKSDGVMSKKEGKALTTASESDRKRMLFVRILMIAMEAASGDEEGEGMLHRVCCMCIAACV